MKTRAKHVDLYQEITDMFVKALEKGVVPWRQAYATTIPVNPVTGKRYRGINVLMLKMMGSALSSADSRWCSFNQAKQRGWNVKNGEKSSRVVFFRMLHIDNVAENEGSGELEVDSKVIPLLRYYNVFNASQIEGIPEFKNPEIIESDWALNDSTRNEIDEFLASVPCVIVEGSPPCFMPNKDIIKMPPKAHFRSEAEYYAVLLHEIAHWTSGENRITRNLRGKNADVEAYAREELRAEIASSLLCANFGIPTVMSNHVSYVSSWVQYLKVDKQEIFRASSDAQKIADFVLSHSEKWRAIIRLSEVGPEETEKPIVFDISSLPDNEPDLERQVA